MKINVQVSEEMTGLGDTEDKCSRIPKKYRKYLGVLVSEHLHLKTKSGRTISLLIKPALFVDAMENENCVYLTQNVFDTLKLDDEINILKSVENITLGCDPECLILDSRNKVIKACDKGIGSKTTEVGHDGFLLEFRPAPSTSETKLVHNLFKLIVEAREIINNIKTIKDPNDVRLVAKSYYDKISVGFHLHFGIPKELICKQAPRIYATNQIVKALDYYLAIPCMILEGNDYIRRTAVTIPYGKPGEYRLQNPTLEYRVLGGHLLRHPILALGAITLGALIVEDVISRIKICTNNYTDYTRICNHEDLIALYPNLPTDPLDICKALCQKTPDSARGYLDSILKDIEYMVTYKKHAHNLVPFVNCVLSNMEINDDIEINWRTYYESSKSGQMEICQTSHCKISPYNT